MADLYGNTTPGLTSPAIDGTMIVPSDGSELSHITRAVYVGGSGVINAELASGAIISLSNVPAGSILPLRLRKVRSSGTTATGLVGLW